MRVSLTAAAGLALCLTLTACPGSMYQVRPERGPAPNGLTFTARSINIANGTGMTRDDPRRIRPAPFYADSYTLWSGDEMIWRIERDQEASCTDDTLPSQIVYGTVPRCFRETMSAKPLEPGRTYRLQGPEHQRLDFTYSDPIQMLSGRGYGHRTRKWRKTHP